MFSIIIRLQATTKCRRIPCHMNVYEMKRFWFKTYLGTLTVAGLVGVLLFTVRQVRAYQDPSIYITVTYSEPINVRGGPSTIHFPIVGRLSPGDTAVALGTTLHREWIQIAYPGAPGGVGWVYA